MFRALRYAVLFGLIAVTAVTGATNKPAPAAGKTPTMVQIIIDGKVADEKAAVIDGQAYVPVSVLPRLEGKAVRYDAAKKQVVAGTDAPGKTESVKPVLEVTMGDAAFKSHIEAMGLSARKETAVPEKLEFYSCVILNNDNAVTPKIANRLKSFVESGGGLVMMGTTPLRLTGEDVSQSVHDDGNLRGIVDWFGCLHMFSVQMQSGNWQGPPVMVITRGNRPLGTSLEENAVLYRYKGDADYAMTGSSDEFCEFQALWQCDSKEVTGPYGAAFLHPYGKGWVYWQSITYDPNYPKLWDLFKAGIYRVATGHNIKAK